MLENRYFWLFYIFLYPCIMIWILMTPATAGSMARSNMQKILALIFPPISWFIITKNGLTVLLKIPVLISFVASLIVTYFYTVGVIGWLSVPEHLHSLSTISKLMVIYSIPLFVCLRPVQKTI